MLNTLAVSGYRSLRDFVVPLRRLNLVTGPNGGGKSNLYRALRLLADIAQGRVIPSIAREGGLKRLVAAMAQALKTSASESHSTAHHCRRRTPDTNARGSSPARR